MTPAERRALLDVARRAIDAHLRGGDPPPLPRFDPASALYAPGGAFVTLRRAGELRGCLGTFERTLPLAATVREMAVAAATRDPRFAAVSIDELYDLQVEVSVLSPPRAARAPDVEIGVHGVQVAADGRRGVLLPRVAVEQGWDAERFLSETCRKAGLGADAWRDEATTIEVFEADAFGDERFGDAGAFGGNAEADAGAASAGDYAVSSTRAALPDSSRR